ncbi:hypothetical protein DL98DRAFT_516926 [Cadophora sp. DSE1049]|nr:hypothetical protein DL98DRAFT_516926 [Cadophora sp. DSE1049]
MALGSPLAIASSEPISKSDSSFDYSGDEDSDDGNTAQPQVPKHRHDIANRIESSSPTSTRQAATKLADKYFNTVDLDDVPSTTTSASPANNASDAENLRYRQPTTSPETERSSSTLSDKTSSPIKSKTLSNPHTPSPQTGDRFYDHIARHVNNDTLAEITPPRKLRKNAVNLDQFRDYAPSKTASPKEAIEDETWGTSVEEQVYFDAEEPGQECGHDPELFSHNQNENEAGLNESTSQKAYLKSETPSPEIVIKDEDEDEEILLTSVQEASRKLQRATDDQEDTVMAGRDQDADEDNLHPQLKVCDGDYASTPLSGAKQLHILLSQP